MKSNEVWSAADADGLRQRRLSAGWDATTLARRSSLSMAQVHQLEEGGDSHFYTPAIKVLAGRQAMRALDTWARHRPARPTGCADLAPANPGLRHSPGDASSA